MSKLFLDRKDKTLRLKDAVFEIEEYRNLCERNKDPEITTELGFQYYSGMVDMANYVLSLLKQEPKI